LAWPYWKYHIFLQGGDGSCDSVAQDGGSIHRIERSYVGEKDCLSVARNDGEITSIEGRRLGDQSCESLARKSGFVGEIISSCKGGTKTCGLVAQDGGSVERIKMSYIGEKL